MDVNNITLLGRVGRDPELKTTKTGKTVVTLSVATNHRAGEKDTTTWHRVVVWDKQAEFAARNLRKGSRVYVEGRLASSKYTAQDGAERESWEVVARQVIALDPSGHAGVGVAGSARTQQELPAVYPAAPDDDIPF